MPSGQARAGQGRPGQARTGQGRPGQASAGQGRPGQARRVQGRPGQARPGQARAGQARAGQGRASGELLQFIYNSTFYTPGKHGLKHNTSMVLPYKSKFEPGNLSIVVLIVVLKF